MKTWTKVLVAVLLVSGISGGSVYYFVNKKAADDKSKLQSQLNTLNTKLVDLNKTLSSAQDSSVSTATPVAINIDKPSETVSVDSIWNKYTNYKIGFSVNYPKNVATNDCEKSANGSSYLMNAWTSFPVASFEDGTSDIYFGPTVFKSLTGETKNSDGSSSFSGCAQKTTTLADFKSLQNSWLGETKINFKTVKSDAELDSFVKTYGSACAVGSKTKVDDYTYTVKIQGDGLGLEDSKCGINFALFVKYSPAKQLLAYANMGQEAHFMSPDQKTSYDSAMFDSFRFIK